MAVRVEALALRVDARDAVALQHVQKLALGDLDPVEEALQRRVLGGGIGGNVLDRAAEVVADREHVAGEIGNGVTRRIGLLALGAAAKVLHVGERAQQAVAHIGILGDERLDLGRGRGSWIEVLGLLSRGLASLGVFRRALIGLVVGHLLSAF